MPTPFMCHGCDKPTMNSDGICDNCVQDSNQSQGWEEVVPGVYAERSEGQRGPIFPLEVSKRKRVLPKR